MYWITTNVWTIGQQQFLRRVIGPQRRRRRRRLPRRRAAVARRPRPPAAAAVGRRVVRPPGRGARRAAAAGNGARERRQGRGAGDQGAAAAAALAQEEALGTEAVDDGASGRQEEIFRDLLEHIAEGLGLEATVEIDGNDEALVGTLHGEDLGIFIGRHGQTIDAVQHLAQRILLANPEIERRRIVVDAEGYRARRREALEKQADQAADRRPSSSAAPSRSTR